MTSCCERQVFAKRYQEVHGEELIVSYSTAKITDITDVSDLKLDWMNHVVGQEGCHDEQALIDTPIIDEHYKMDWVVMKRCDVPPSKVTTVQPVQFHRAIDEDILDIHEVARKLRCTADRVSRIPKEELAVSKGPGRPNLYLRVKVIEYVEQRRIEAPIDASFIEEVLR